VPRDLFYLDEPEEAAPLPPPKPAAPRYFAVAPVGAEWDAVFEQSRALRERLAQVERESHGTDEDMEARRRQLEERRAEWRKNRPAYEPLSPAEEAELAAQAATRTLRPRRR
jgi:hypothetical protein